MTDIVQYRCRIGIFCQKMKSRKLRYYNSSSSSRSERLGRRTLSVCLVLLRLVTFLVLTSHVLTPVPVSVPVTATPASPCYMAAWPSVDKCEEDEDHCVGLLRNSVRHGYMVGAGNFWARYTYGNIRGVKGIKNIHFNIRSLRYKVGEIKNLINQEHPQILGLSEVELRRENFDSSTLKVPGYDILFPKSWEVHGFARVVIYVKKTFKYEQVNDLEDDLIQSIWIKAGWKNSKRIYFCHAYREHASLAGGSVTAQKDYLNRFLGQWEAAVDHSSSTEPNEVHVCLDMNLDYQKENWLQPSYRLCSLTRLVQNVCNTNNFAQLVSQPTRTMHNSVTGTTEVSCIDHVYSNARHKCSTPSVTISGASDHDVVSYVRYSKDPPDPARTIRRRSYKNFKLEEFITDLSVINWSEVYTAVDVDEATEIFTHMFKNILNQHAPWVIFQVRKKYSPWITEKTKDMMKERDCWKKKARDLAVQGPGIATDEQRQAWDEYKKWRNKVNSRKKLDETEYKREKIMASVDDPAKVWGTTKKFMNWKSSGTPVQIEMNNKMYTSAKAIAEIMNEYFIDKVRLIRAGMGHIVTNLAQCRSIMENKRCSLDLQHVTVGKVRKLLASLSTSKCTAIDELDNFSVKVAADIIAAPVHHIVTLSIMQQRFPSQWKYAKVLPLHKKLSTVNRKNYRPVALLSPLSRVLEKVAYEQLYSYFTVNKILHQNLHGYRRNRSTLTALLQMYDRWIQAAVKGQVSGAVLLDLSAAFDLVSPDILLNKLEIYGIKSDFLAWIKSYLLDRQQAVWIDHTLSDFLTCDVGVPQGSNLGPLFFMIFVNDLPFSLSCDMDQYADDSTITATGKNIEEIDQSLEINCAIVSNWMAENKLKLNADKTHVLTLGTRERLAMPGNKVSVCMDGLRLQESPEKCEDLLGCVISANLKWHHQVQQLLKKLKMRLAGLAHIQFVLPYNLRKAVSEGLFTSVLAYCLPLYGGCDLVEIRDIQILQNKAAQLVTHSPPRSNRNVMYDKLGWLTVNQLVRYFTLLTVFRIRMSGDPEYLAASLCSDNRNGRIFVQNVGKTFALKSFKIRGACHWNDLPARIRSLVKIGQFKKEIRTWIKQNVTRFLD